MNWTYDDSNDCFDIRLGKFTAPRGIELADVTEAVYYSKNNKSDPDGSAVVTLTLGSGITKVAGDTEEDATLKVQFRSTDFGAGKLEQDGKYFVCVGIKTSMMNKFLELPLVDDRLRILRDCIHD